MRRVFLLAAVVMPLIQLGSLYFNARRFAVGAQRSWVFLGKSRWTPGLGWAPWLSLGVLACAVLLAVVVVRDRPARSRTEERTPTGVER